MPLVTVITKSLARVLGLFLIDVKYFSEISDLGLDGPFSPSPLKTLRISTTTEVDIQERKIDWLL